MTTDEYVNAQTREAVGALEYLRANIKKFFPSWKKASVIKCPCSDTKGKCWSLTEHLRITIAFLYAA